MQALMLLADMLPSFAEAQDAFNSNKKNDGVAAAAFEGGDDDSSAGSGQGAGIGGLIEAESTANMFRGVASWDVVISQSTTARSSFEWMSSPDVC